MGFATEPRDGSCVQGRSQLVRAPGYDRWPSRGFASPRRGPGTRPCVRACADPRPPSRTPIQIGRSQRKPRAAGAGASGLRGRPGCGLGQVVAARRDVVGRVGVKQRGEVLDLAAADAELDLAAAVVADPLRRAVVVEVEQLAQAAEARGLDVDHPRRERAAPRCPATEWIGASHEMRSRWAASTASVSGVSAGSSIQASGNASATRRYSAGSAGWSTIEPE